MQPASDRLHNFRLYREIEVGEFFVVFGDTAQGGSDKNNTQFMSATRLDFPLVYSMRGVAAEATPYIHSALEWIFDQTKVQPVFAFERNNGGSSEMYRLDQMNRLKKYLLYRSYDTKGKRTDKLGWDTNSVTRPKMIGDWKVAFEQLQVKIYDPETIEQHSTFIVNKNNKPEADTNMHDDAVMASAGAFQLFQTERKPKEPEIDDTADSGIKSFIY